jgi:hypothetical protein
MGCYWANNVVSPQAETNSRSFRGCEAKMLRFWIAPRNAFEEFLNGLGCDAKPHGNLLVCHSMSFKPTEQAVASMRDSNSRGGMASGTAQGGKAAGIEATLISQHTVRRTPKSSCDLLLTGLALIYEGNHCVTLGHLVSDDVRVNGIAKTITIR